MSDRCENCGRLWFRPGSRNCTEVGHAVPTRAQRIVADIERELHDRQGCGWQGVDSATADEIRDRIAEIIDNQLTDDSPTVHC